MRALLCCSILIATLAPVDVQAQVSFGCAGLDNDTGERLPRFEEYSGAAFDGFLRRIPGIRLSDRKRVEAAILQQTLTTSRLSEDPVAVGKIATAAGVGFLFTGIAKQYTADDGEESLTVELVVVDATTNSYVFRRTYSTHRRQGAQRGHRELLDAILAEASPDLAHLVSDLQPRVAAEEAAAAEAARRREEAQRAEEAKRAEMERERQAEAARAREQQAAEERRQREARELAAREQQQQQLKQQERQQQERQAQKETQPAQTARHPASSEAVQAWMLGWESMANNQFAKALASFQDSADAGDGDAAFEIGQIYQFGWGVAKSLETAEQWYERGATLGSPMALQRLGTFYYRALGGLQKDRAKTIELEQAAVAAGESDAAEGMAEVEKNQAQAWHAAAAALKVAAKPVCNQARAAMASLMDHMYASPEFQGNTAMIEFLGGAEHYSPYPGYKMKVESVVVTKVHGDETECEAFFESKDNWSFMVHRLGSGVVVTHTSLSTTFIRDGVTYLVTRATWAQHLSIETARMMISVQGYSVPIGLHDHPG